MQQVLAPLTLVAARALQPAARTGHWSAAPGLLMPEWSVTLKNDRVLIPGGYGGGPGVYDPSSDTWSFVAPTPSRRVDDPC